MDHMYGTAGTCAAAGTPGTRRTAVWGEVAAAVREGGWAPAAMGIQNVPRADLQAGYKAYRQVVS